jgi:hypothetical protein
MLSGQMASRPPNPDLDSAPEARATSAPSDLIGVRLTLYLGVAIIAILAAFFLVGAVAGIATLLVAVVLGVLVAVAAIRRADEPS